MKKIFTLFIFCSFVLSGNVYSQCSIIVADDGCTGATLDVGDDCEIQIRLQNNIPFPAALANITSGSQVASGAGASALSFSSQNFGSLYIVTVTNDGTAGVENVTVDVTLEDSSIPCDATHTSAFGVLPVELISFSGDLKDEGIELDWITASEINNEGFTVERSFDGRNFETIGEIAGAGTSFEVQNYSFVDGNALGASDIAYYRLLQKDFDAETAEVITDVLAVSLNANDAFAFNRVNSNGNNVSVSFSSLSEENVTVSVIDISGKILAESVVSAEEGYNMVDLEVNVPLNGIYVLRLTGEKEVITQKFLK